jgi:hypothetical protein
MTTNLATPTIGAALVSAAAALALTVALQDILAASDEPEMQDDPEGVFAAWLAEVPGAQEAAPALLEALQTRMEQDDFADVATYGAAINAFWALRAAMISSGMI